MRARFAGFCSLAAVLILSILCSAQTGDFTIIALPDTQNESQFFPGVLDAQNKWIVSNQKALNIQMVLGEGDIVNDFSSPAQQQSADAAFRILDNAGIPYLLAIGNHDYDNAAPKADRPVSGFNRFFGPSRYAGRTYYRGNFPADSNENFYGILSIAEKKYLFLILEFMPRPASISWAESVLQANPDKEVIVVTHSFTFIDDTRVDFCDTGDMPVGNATGDDLWQVLRKSPNVIMVLSGHLTDGQAAHRSDIADKGNLVNQIFANYQTFPHGGDGWLRIITFHPATNTISIQTYSPFLNKFKTDDRNQFTVPYHNPHLQTGAGKLSGMVRSASDCKPIAGAMVSTNGQSATTDDDGRYSLQVPPGSYQVTVTAPKWRAGNGSESVADGFATDLNFFLNAEPSVPCGQSAALPSVIICTPGDDAVVSSPVNIVAATADHTAVGQMQAFLDGKGVSSVSGGTLEATVKAEKGRHHLTVTASDNAGAAFSSSIDFSVGDQIAPVPPPERLTVSVSPAQATVAFGQSARFTLALGTDGSLVDPVTFSCSGLPSGTSCAFDPIRIKAAKLPALVKLKISTTAVRSATIRSQLLWAAILVPALVLVPRRRAGTKRRGLLPIAFLLILALTAAGCAGLITPANRGSFNVTVTSTSGSVQKSGTVHLTLQ